MKFSVTIVFDNNCVIPEVKPEWGFACVIKTGNEMILFDTGNDGRILLDNLAKLHLDPYDLSKVVISHMHWDHVGGLPDLLQACPQSPVYLPASALEDDIRIIRRMCRAVIPVREAVEIAPDLYSTGELPGYAWEQSLIYKGNGELSIITGCAHPGIVNIVRRAQDMFPGLPVSLLLGGFHLHHTAPADIVTVYRELQAAGVKTIAPAHCTGEGAIEKCRDIFGDGFLTAGVGFNFMLT
ncbi:MAG TPA: MBL fold metallo-hydrolase [bacterium]|nr:MBL fold metallo-hydrolase [bacterium]HPN43068.1 MBL fold metallo-hydrolase [bacterium]